MRMVHVTSGLVRRAAGVREVVMGLARAQREIGMEVSVVGLDHADWAAERHDWDDIPTRVVPAIGPKKLGYAPRLAEILFEQSPDVVHLHGLWMYPGRSVLQWHRATGRPYLLSTHGMLSRTALTYGRCKKRVVSWLFQDAVFRNATVFHATSTGEAEDLRTYGLCGPICIVPNGVSEIAPPEGPPGGGRTILSVGRIHKIKALDQLILAWQGLQCDFPDWSVLIVGADEGGEVARLQALIAAMGVQRVVIRGPVYGAEKVALMAGAGLFALPSRSENFALTVAESLMLGVPVIASQGAPWPGLETEKCGLWVPFGAQHMATGLRRLLRLSDDERHNMGQLGRAWMLRDFSWRAVAERMWPSAGCNIYTAV